MQKPSGQQQQTGGSLFGGSTAQSQPQQTGSLFGGALGQQNQSLNQTQNQQQAGGLFGGLGQQQQKPATPSLFGSTTNQPKPSPSLFGSSFQQPQQQQQQQPSLFSSMAPQNPPSNLFGGNLTLGSHSVGPPNTLSSSTVPGVKIDISNVRGTTRFADLHQDIQSDIEQIDKFIQEQTSFCSKVTESLASHGVSVASIPPDVTFLENRVAVVEMAIDNDSTSIDRLKAICRKDADDALLSIRAIENLKLPQQFHYAGMTGLNTAARAPPKSSTAGLTTSADDAIGTPVDLVAYFSTRSDGLNRTLDEYCNQMKEIEAHLRTVEAGTMQRMEELMARGTGGPRGAGGDEKRDLMDALKAMDGAILGVARKVGDVKEKVVERTVGAVGR